MLMPILNPIMREILGARVGGSAPFDIASTNPSAIYDRTVLATLFQDYTGTIPVTAASQPVGLMLDKSQGLVLGPELVANGAFDAGITGWTSAAALSWNSGSQSMTVTPSAFNQSVHNTGFPAVVAGRSYKVTVTTSHTRGTVRTFEVRVGGGVATFTGPTGQTVNASVIVLATSTAALDIRYAGIEFDFTWTVDNISVKELPGNHATQPTAGKRPLTAGSPIYANFDAVDDDLTTTFPASLGAGCTVCRSLPGTGASITTGVTIGTTFTDNVDAHALLIFTAAQWAALDAGQIAKITTWLNGRAGL